MRYFVTALISAMFVFLPQLAAAESAIVVQMSGTVTVRPQDSTEEKTVELNQKLPEGSVIKTAAGSSASIRLEDGSLVDLKESSEIMLSANARKKAKKNSVVLFFGTIWSKVTKSFSGNESYAVYTPNGVAGVRGTEFSTTVSVDGSVRVKVKEGLVNVDGQNNNEVLLKANEEVDADENGLGQVKAFSDEMADFKWRAERKIRMQREGNAIANRVKDNIMGDKSTAEKLQKERKKLEAQRAKLEKKLKNGSSSTRAELSRVMKELAEVNDKLAAIIDRAQSKCALYDHFARLVDTPDFAQLDGKTIKSNASLIAGIKKQFDEMAAYGMDTSMESMDDMMNEYSSGKRGTLKENNTAADDLFGSSPF